MRLQKSRIKNKRVILRLDEYYTNDLYLREGERLVNPTRICLQRAISEVGIRALFEYDFGDGWEISLTLERIRGEEISLALLP
ncbi:MAG: IS1096 element passenger TnpR family protein, partial [Enterococcus lemanii]